MAGRFKLLSVLLLTLFTFSVYADLLASIDCAASENTTDSNSIAWTSDETLVSNGIARVVDQSRYSISTVMDTLRVFTTRKKNCYSTPVTKGDKVLVRASFNYGNYDRLLSPPTFDLHFDGNHWASVETSLGGLTMYEVTYVAKRDTVSVCVARTEPNQFPFISALEVRRVDSGVYRLVNKNRALFLISRIAYGASGNIRYPSDPYDRIWLATLGGNGTFQVTNDAPFINSTAPDNPPSEILRSAITVESRISTDMILGTVFPSSTPVYVNMYFTEVRSLDSNQTRSFRVHQSTNGLALSPSITPPYGRVDEFSFSNYTVELITNLLLLATLDSDLPPLISAIEAFNVSGVLTDGTDRNGVEALALLQTAFDVLGGWSGDPCLPARYPWDWLNCSNDAKPRITALYLDSFNLSGSLPDISAMDALTIIDLHNNSLTGTIPSFLGTLPNLQQLNLASNLFSGAIPTSISKNNKMKLIVSGNPSLFAPGKSWPRFPRNIDVSHHIRKITKSNKKSNLHVILGISIPTFLLICVIVSLFTILHKRAKPTIANTTFVTGHTGRGAHGKHSGGANGISNELHKFGEEMVNHKMENRAKHTFGSPTPLLDISGQTKVRSP